MPERIVPTIDPASIGATIEASLNAYLLSFARLPGAVLHDGPAGVWVDSGGVDGSFNAVVSAHLTPDTADEQIEAILEHFRGRGRPVTWHVGPSSEPADLGRMLLAHGMAHGEDEPGMAIEIDRMRHDVMKPPGFTIETVHDAGDLEAWVSVWLFPVPGDVRRRHLAALFRRGLGDDLPWRLYVGWRDGKPVATSELFLGAGVAAVHHVVTLPGERRQGIGTAMTLRVLREARARGYRVGVLSASPDGIGIYRRIGFQEYCWFHRFEWSPRDDGSG